MKTTAPALALLAAIVTVPAAADEDVYRAGASVTLDAEVTGDLLAVGGTVEVARAVRGDAMLAGGTVEVRAPIGDDLRAAGGTLRLDGAVADDAVLAGGRVHVTRDARIGGRAWLAGGEVVLDGRVGGELRAAGGTVVLAGEVGGEAELSAETVELRPGAHIAGSLRYRSPNKAMIAPDARIDGEVRHLGSEQPPPGVPASGLVGPLVALLALAVTGIVLYLLFPDLALGAARLIATAPWAALGLGFATLIATPVLVVLLFLTVLGIPLGLVLLAGYLILVLGGFLVGGLFLADAALGRLAPARRAKPATVGLALTGALGALALLRLVPVLGALASFVVLLLGLGALLLRFHRAIRPVSARAAA